MNPIAGERIEVATQDRRLRNAQRLLTAGIALGVAVLFGTGATAVVMGWLTTSWGLVAIGLVIVGFGALGIRSAYRSVFVEFDHVTVDSVGVTIGARDGRLWTAVWKDPDFRLVLLDYRNNHHVEARKYSEIPCQLLSAQFEVGLSPEAVEAMRGEARSHGLPIVEEVTEHGTRTYRIG